MGPGLGSLLPAWADPLWQSLGLAGDSAAQFCPFLAIERSLLQGAATEIDRRRPAQQRPELRACHG